MSAQSDYIDRYAEYAMEQMRRYGIPASVTLAQGIIESASGQSRLAVRGNNHFGIKASRSWIDGGGRYGLHSDDKPDEKFCYYDSVADSYEHHSRVLKGASRYAGCFALSPDDYRGWARGLQSAGYATSQQYASSLISVIERNDLTRFDRQVMEQMQREGRTIGEGSTQQEQVDTGAQSAEYSFPLKREEFLFISSPFGNRRDPMDHSKTQFHKGIDIRCNYEPLLATESGGRVVAVSHATNTAGGKTVTIEYPRADGSATRVSYVHMSEISVQVGDKVTAGQQIGVSGNTGTRTTGPHLHFSVKQVSADGTSRHIDPTIYLAEIAVKGNIAQTAMYNGQDVLARYKSAIVQTAPQQADGQAQVQQPVIDTTMSPDEWMKKLLSSEDSGVEMPTNGDPILEMAMTLFTSLMLLATQIDGQCEAEQRETATQAALTRQIDLSILFPNLQSCALRIDGQGAPILTVNCTLTQRLSNAETVRLQSVLSDSSLTDQQKQQRIAAVIGGIVAQRQASLNFEQSAGQSVDQSQTLSR